MSVESQKTQNTKSSVQLVTLSPKHSRYIRALAHACGTSDINQLIEDTFFKIAPANNLECLADDFEKGSPESERRWEAQEMASAADQDWDKFVKIAEKMPAFQAEKYRVATA